MFIFPACEFLVNMMSNTKFRCVPCVIDSYPASPRLWIQSMQPLLEAAHADLELREIVEVQDGSVHKYFSASAQYGNGTHSSGFASMPPC